MAARSGPAEDGGAVDWRRLASDRNVSHVVARGLWERARTTAPNDPVQAERAFRRLLEDAAAANVTPEPGRETLVDSAGPRDAASLGPGKWTRVLEEQKPGGPAGSAKQRAPENAAQAQTAQPAPAGAATPDAGKPAAKPASAEGLRRDLVSAAQASQNAAAILAASDPATILEALRELREMDGPAVLQKIMNVAGSAIERILGQQLPDPEKQTPGPVGERVKFSAGDEEHTQYVDDDGVPMMASIPKPVSQKVEDWRAYVATLPPDIQQRVAPELARAAGLSATATDQAKKAKAGDAAAKSALTSTQQALAASLGSISRQVGAEPTTKPVIPAPAPSTPGPAVPGAKPAAATPTPATPTPAVAPAPPDPLAVKAADDLIQAAFRVCGTKLPPPLGALSPQQRIDESAKPPADLRHQHHPTFDSLKLAMSPVALEKSTQLDLEVGLEKGAEILPAKFKGDVLAAFHADSYPKARDFETLFNEVAKAGSADGTKYLQRGKALTAAEFNAAAPGDMSLARVINTEGAFSRYLVKDDAEADYLNDFPGTKPTLDELTAYAVQKAQAGAPAAVQRYVSPKVVEYPSWVFPEPDIKSDAAFSQYCDLLALYANWYPRGHLRMVVKRSAVTTKIANNGLRKPTVFDGTLSPLWLQRDNRDHAWGKTGGGLREALIKIDWADIDHSKWVLATIDPKYAAILAAQRAQNAAKSAAKPAGPPDPKALADAKLIAEHEKDMVGRTKEKQAAQRKEDVAATQNTVAGAQPDEVTKTPAEPITIPTTMAGAPHTLKADPAVGKVELHSIAGFAVEKLQSVVDLVPKEIRQKVTNALAVAVDAATMVADAALKAGAKPSDRQPVLLHLRTRLTELAAAIRAFGDTGKITDANPEAVKRARAEEEERAQRMAQPAAPATAPTPAAAAASPAATAPAAPTAANAPAAAAPATAAPASPAASPASTSAAPASPAAASPASASAAPASPSAASAASASAAPASPASPASASAAPASPAAASAGPSAAPAPAAAAAPTQAAAPAAASAAPTAAPAAPTAATPASAAATPAPASPESAAPASAAPAAATAPAAPATPESAPVAAPAAPTAAAPATSAPAPAAVATPAAPTPAGPEAASPPTHTPEQSKAEIAAVTSAPLEQGKAEPPAKLLVTTPPVLTIKTDSSDPIRLKDEVISLTKAYLELDKRVPEALPAERKAALDEIQRVFGLLRVAMKKARGEDDNLVLLRVKFEKFLGEKATHVWPQGHACVDQMAGQARAMMVEVETSSTVEAGKVDQELAKLSPQAQEAIAKKLGTDINVGFAGAVGKTFAGLMQALTSGSLVQKAQTLINFAENYLTAELTKGTAQAVARTKANLATLQGTDANFDLDKRLKDAEGKDAKTAYKILCSSPVFLAKMAQIKAQNKNNDAEREAEGGPLKNKGRGEAALGGDMDTKTPQQPVENLDEKQLEFLSQQGAPKVDLTPFKTIADAADRKAKMVQALKAAGITTSKAPGVKDSSGKTVGSGMVDATSIDEESVKATINQITVENRYYIEGKSENIVDPKAQWIKDSVAAKAPLKAGISGTTARFAGAANLLGGSTHGAVVAMIGHLQAIEAHSFWEIVDAAGIGMTPGKYTPFAPNPSGMTSAATEFATTHATDIALGPTDAAEKQKVLLGETK